MRFGGAEGATGAAAHMAFVDEGEAFDFAEVVVGGGLGCAAGGVLDAAFARFSRKTDDVVPEVRAVDASPWTLGWSSRGLAIEEALGGNLPTNFPTIDRLAERVATSIKSIDLSAATYQSSSRLNSRLKGYVDSVAEFESATLSGVDVVEGIHFDSLELVIAVQPNAATSAQQGVLDSIVDYGVTREVVVQIVEIS